MITTMHFSWHWTRIAGLGLVAIPLSLLVLFTYGESTGGDLSGLQHLVEAVPLAALVALAWYRPRVGGPLLAASSALIGLLFFVATGGQVSPGLATGTALVFFAPPLLAGVLFWAGGRHEVTPQRPAGA